MSILTLKKGGRMMLRTRGDVPKELNGFRKGRYDWSLPICGDIVRRLMRADPELLFSPELEQRLHEIAVRQQHCQEIKECEGAYGDERLRPFQRVAVRWLSTIRRGILADAQGLGKTVMVVSAAKALNPKRTIVIVPEVKINDWATHIKEWAGKDTLKLTGTSSVRAKVLEDWHRDGGYIAMNFTVLQLHLNDILRMLGENDLLIVDEAHKLRNRKTGAYKAALKISRKVGSVFLATASPTVNVVEDIWALLNIIDSGRFGSFWGFVDRFCTVSDNGFGLKIEGVKPDEVNALKQIISTYIIRREGQLELKDINFRRVDYVMKGEQLRLYKEMDRDSECKYNEHICTAWTGLSQITRLRQLALSPALMFEDYVGASKLDHLHDMVMEQKGQVVMFATYAKLVKLATQVLKTSGIHAVSVSGDQSAKQRAEALASFRSGDARVIVLTHGTGGEGLDLVEANRAIFLEYAWHPAGNEHAAKRIHRYGQLSENVQVTFLHAVDSIEDHIYELVQQKKEVTINELLGRRQTQE